MPLTAQSYFGVSSESFSMSKIKVLITKGTQVGARDVAPGDVLDVSLADAATLIELGKATRNAQRIADREAEINASAAPVVETAAVVPVVEVAALTAPTRKRRT